MTRLAKQTQLPLLNRRPVTPNKMRKFRTFEVHPELSSSTDVQVFTKISSLSFRITDRDSISIRRGWKLGCGEQTHCARRDIVARHRSVAPSRRDRAGIGTNDSSQTSILSPLLDLDREAGISVFIPTRASVVAACVGGGTRHELRATMANLTRNRSIPFSTAGRPAAGIQTSWWVAIEMLISTSSCSDSVDVVSRLVRDCDRCCCWTRNESWVGRTTRLWW